MSRRLRQEPAEPKLVFSDPEGRRRRLLAFFVICLAVALAALAAAFLARIDRMDAPLSVLPAPPDLSAARYPTRDLASRVLLVGDEPGCDVARPAAGRVSAFVPASDETALSGLRRHCADLSEVFYASAVLGRAPVPPGETFGAFPAWEYRGAEHAARGPARWPFLSPEIGLARDEVVALLTGDVAAAIATALPAPDLARASGVTGVCLDLSGFADIPPAAVLSALSALRRQVQAAGLGLCVTGPAEAAFLREPDVLAAVDIAVAVLMAADPAPTVAPAPRDWIDRQLAELTAVAGAGTIRFAVLAAGLSWEGGQRRSSLIPYAVAMEQAAAHGADPALDPATGSLTIRFIDADRRPNQIWLPDAVTLAPTIHAIPDGGPVVLWPIGHEDPTLWSLLEGAETAPASVSLAGQVLGTNIGNLAIVTDAGQPGTRRHDLAAGPGTAPVTLAYDTIPRAPHLGAIGQTARPGVVLTFDGLGRPADLDIILATLSGAQARATFFLGLQDTLLRGDRIARLLADGHDIGLLVEGDAADTGLGGRLGGLRLNLAQHALRHHAGIVTAALRHKTRSPLAMTRVSDIAVIKAMQDKGRLEVPMGISAPFGPIDTDALHETILTANLSDPLTFVRFDLTDGNARAVSDALGTTLGLLRAEGVDVLSLPEVVSAEARALNAGAAFAPDLLDRAIYGSLRLTWTSVESFFLALAVFVLIRAPLQIGLALTWRNRFGVDPEFEPEVTVIVPAYNEERVIERTIRSILASSYRNLRVTVIDDGSGDRTAQIVDDLFAADPRVSLIRETNHGKWYAEDLAIRRLDSPVFVVIDADTLLHPDAIRLLVQPFRDPTVGAVAGTVEVGNQVNFLSRCQSIEYVVSQALMRRAYQAFNGIMVVPGAIGAWRTAAVRQAGLASGDTITEDADLTVAVNRANYRIVCQPDALSYTEAPETLRQFMKQRLRWSLGILQVCWKHKRAIIEGRGVGVISILESLWYRLVSGVVYPLMDLVLLAVLVQSAHALAVGGEPAVLGLSARFYLAIGALVLFDLTNLSVAFWLRGRWDWSLFLTLPFLRLGYVQILYLSSFRALYHALSGNLDVWDKLLRTGHARMPKSADARAHPR